MPHNDHGYKIPGFFSDDGPSGSSPARQRVPPVNAHASQSSSRTGQGARSSQRKNWRPRQCRICLDTVQPTFSMPSEHLPGFLQSTGRVKYEDENGRLIRPCLCKGSSKFVHEACLQAWRHADPNYSQRNFWQCPTCCYKYRLARLGAGRFFASPGARIILTVLILIAVVFILGFMADPIINIYLDPWSYLLPWRTSTTPYYYDDDDGVVTWYEHFAKGFASMGVLGFFKVLLASPLTYFRIGGGARRNTGRERYEQISWLVLVIGIGTFLMAIYKGTQVISRRVLDMAGERVLDAQNDADDADDDDDSFVNYR